MKWLLDTHVWLWLALDPGRVAAGVRAQVVRAETEVHVSIVTLWEVVIKTGLGKLKLPDPIEVFWHRQTVESGFVPLPIRAEHVLDVAKLPSHHRDPFDRLLVAQARVEGFTLVTADTNIRAYPVATLPAEGP